MNKKFIIGIFVSFSIGLYLIFCLIPERPYRKPVYNFGAVQFIENNGWVLDYSGRLFHSSDSGKHWHEYKNLPVERIPFKATLSNLCFIDEKTGWVTGENIILHTYDAGLTWIHVSPPRKNCYWNQIYFIDENHGWIAGNGLFYTEDEGKNWTSKTPCDFITAFYFFNRDVAWAWSICSGLDNAGIYKTLDTGNTWENIYSERKILNEGLADVYFVNESLGWRIQNEGGNSIQEKGKGLAHIPSASRIYKTADGGKSWILNKEFKEEDLRNIRLTKIRFINSEKGWVIGSIGGGLEGKKYTISKALIIYTEDGGNSWSFKEFKEIPVFTDMCVVDSTTVIFSGLTDLVKYKDGKFSFMKFNIVN